MSQLLTQIPKEKKWLYSMVPKHVDLTAMFLKRRDADKARVFLQLLFHIRRKMKENEKFAPKIKREECWCPVYSETAKSLVYDYKRIARILESHGVIEYKKNSAGKPSYFPNKNSMLYRVIFPKHLLVQGIKKYRREKVFTKGVIKAVGRHYDKRYQDSIDCLLEKAPWYQPSIDFLNRLYLELPEDPCSTIDGFEQYHEILSYNFNYGIGWFIHMDNYGGRIYSHLTNLPKILRPYLKLEGGKGNLLIADVCSAQPYLLSAIFRYPKLIGLIPEFTPLYPRIERLSDKPSTKLFFDDCANGIVYDKLMMITGLDKGPLKEMLFGHVFYSSLYKYTGQLEIGLERHRIQRNFWSLYLDPFRTVLTLKSTKRETIPLVDVYRKDHNGQYNMYNTPNVMAARLEVEILLKRITRRCGCMTSAKSVLLKG